MLRRRGHTVECKEGRFRLPSPHSVRPQATSRSECMRQNSLFFEDLRSATLEHFGGSNLAARFARCQSVAKTLPKSGSNWARWANVGRAQPRHNARLLGIAADLLVRGRRGGLGRIVSPRPFLERVARHVLSGGEDRIHPVAVTGSPDRHALMAAGWIHSGRIHRKFGSGPWICDGGGMTSHQQGRRWWAWEASRLAPGSSAPRRASSLHGAAGTRRERRIAVAIAAKCWLNWHPQA
jgi:hypothetical protein